MKALLGPFVSPGANVVVTGRVPFDVIEAIARFEHVGRVFVCEPSRSRLAKLAFDVARAQLANVEAWELTVGLRSGEPLSSTRFAPAEVLVCDRATANAAIASAGPALQGVLVIDGDGEAIEGSAPLALPEGFVRCDPRDGRLLFARATADRDPWLGDAFATFAAQYDARQGALAGAGSIPDWLRILRRHLQDLLAQERFVRLVDVGCTSGLLAQEAWRAGVAYVGVDVVPAQLEDAKRACAHVPSASFVAADATRALDVPTDGSLVIVKEVLQHLGGDSRSALLASLARFDDVLLVDDASLEPVAPPARDGGYAPVPVRDTALAGYAPAYTYYVSGAAKVVRARSTARDPALLLPPSSPAHRPGLPPAPIYDAGFYGFGDLWAIASEAIDRSILEERPIRLARVRSYGIALGSKFEEILAVLDHGQGRVELVDHAGTHDLTMEPIGSVDPWNPPKCVRGYRPTTSTWRRERAGRHVAVQIESRVFVDGRYGALTSNPLNAWRTLPQSLVDATHALLAELGFEIVPIGAHLTVGQCVAIAATSRFYVGMDSGMTHLCHSVRVPMALFAYANPAGITERSFHGAHPYEPFTDEGSLRAAIEKILAET